MGGTMITIRKYEFDVAGLIEEYMPESGVSELIEVRMPEGAKVLAFGSQKPRTVCAWAIVNTENSPELRTFRLHSTGYPLPENCSASNHVATVMDGAFVWHVFETEEPQHA